jgi:hypothetical protein
VSYFLASQFTGKQLDEETGLLYFGARYLDPQASMWLSADPAMGEYVPAPGKGADELPGMGVFTIPLICIHIIMREITRYGIRTRQEDLARI